MLRKIVNLLPLCLATAVLPACSTAAERPEIPGCRIMECVAIGEPQEVWDGLSVTPLEVLEDSRCPIEAECVWEGRVRVAATLDLGHESISATIDSGEPLRIHGGFLSIAEIAPDMSTQWSPIDQKEYRFGFKFAPDIMERSERGATH